MIYLLDTNILIYAFAGKEPYAKFLRTAILEESLCFSVIVAAEFLSGAEEKEKGLFENLLNEFEVSPVTIEIARIAALYRKSYRKILRLPDALVAAACQLHNATLVTNNLRDFPMKDIQKIIL